LAYEKGFEKRALEQQAAILGVLQKIQIALEVSSGDSRAVSSLTSAPTEILNRTNELVVSELQTQTSILKDIKSSIKSAISNRDRDAGQNETRSAKDKIIEVARNVGDTVKNIALLAGSIIIFAGALKFVSAIIKPQDLIVIVPFMLVMSLAFAAFSTIVEASKGLTAKEAFSTGLLMLSIATSIVGIAGIFSVFKSMGKLTFPDPLWVLGAGLAIFIFTLPVLLLVKAMSSGSMLGDRKVAPTVLSPKIALTVGLLMITTAIAIAGVATVFSKMLVPVGPQDAPDIVWALTAGLGIAIFGLTTSMFIKNIKQSGGYSDMLRIPIIIAGAIIATAVGMVGAAYVMKGFPQVGPQDAPDIVWALTTGLSLAIFSLGMVLLSRYVKDTKSALVGGLSMIIVAGIIFTTAWIFNYLPSSLRTPSSDFVKGAGIAIVAFGAAYVLMSKFIKSPEMLKGALAMIITAALIVGVAHIFQSLPSDLRFPSEEFSIGAGIAIAVFGAAVAGVGLLVKIVTPAGFAMGALGVLISALTIVGVAWIFSILPESLFTPGGIIYKATDALFYFGNGMINLFEKFGNAVVDIGLKFINGLGNFFSTLNTLDLFKIAGGLAAIAGSMVLLTGALVGSSVSSVVSAGANLVNSVLDFGAGLLNKRNNNSTPQGFLEFLIDNESKISIASNSIKLIGNGIKEMVESIPAANTVLQNFMNVLIGRKKGSGTFPGVKQTAYTIMDEIVLGFNSMSIQLDKLVTYKKPLEQMADSMKKFAEGTGEFARAINSIQIENLNTLQSSIQNLNTNLTEGLIQRLKQTGEQMNKISESSGGVGTAVAGAITKITDKLVGNNDKDKDLATKIAEELVKVLRSQGSIVINQSGSATFQFKDGNQIIADMLMRG